MKTLPLDVRHYRSTPDFMETTVPDALLREHTTKPGTWGLIHVIEGELDYRILEPVEECVRLRNNAGTCDYREPEWVAAALVDRAASARRFYKATELRSYLDADKRPYIHLLDGGLSDNTGVRALLDRVPAEENSLRLAQALGAPALRKVVLIMVSAETQPDLSLDRVGSVPTIFQVIRNVKDIPINRYSFETTELFKAHFDAWARRGREQGGDAQATEFYLVEVTLEAIPDEQERQRFMRIPTSFYLPAEKVDELRQLAARLLTDSPDYRRLLHDLGTGEGIDLRTEQVSPEAH